MEYIITTDTHFEHKNIIEYAKRPVGFEQQIIDGLEVKANLGSTLIHLGNICWKNDRYWNRQLTSMPYYKKWLIRGNHDKKADSWYLNNGWDFVGNYITINYENTVVVFSHKPVELMAADINLFGHFHNATPERVKEIEPELFEIANKPGHMLLMLEHHYTPFKLKHLLKGIK